MKGDNLAHLMRVVRTFVCFFDEYAGCIFKISKSNSESATKGICFVPVSKIENTDVGCSELCNRWINLELPAKYRHNIIYHMKLLKHRQTFKFNVVENNLNWKLHPITSEKYAHQLPFESGLFGQIQFTEINSMNSGGLVMAIMLNCHKIVKFPNLCEDRTFWVGFLFQSLSFYFNLYLYTLSVYHTLVNWMKHDKHTWVKHCFAHLFHYIDTLFWYELEDFLRFKWNQPKKKKYS